MPPSSFPELPLFQIEIEGQNPIRLEGDEYRIGRASNCDIQINSGRVSRHHATLKRKAEGWTLIDESSVNGTFVNEELVSSPRLLTAGDRLQFNGSAIASFTEAPTLCDIPTALEDTDPGDTDSAFATLNRQLSAANAENKAFHRELAAEFRQLSAKVDPLIERVVALEEKAKLSESIDARFGELLNQFQIDIRKATAVGLWAGALIALSVLGSQIYQQAERKRVHIAISSTLISPGGLGAAMTFIICGIGSVAVSPSKVQNVSASSQDLRLDTGQQSESIYSSEPANRGSSSNG